MSNIPFFDAPMSFFDAVPQPGDNFKTAKFACWIPSGVQPKGVVVMTPGSNSDGRKWVKDSLWREFAKKNSLALVGCYFEDHAPSFVEQYIEASKGSGLALLKALDSFGLRTAKLFLWGFSAGGEFNYEFTCWLAPKEPGRVRAFVVNKGGVYYSLLAPEETRMIPAIFFVGSRDEQWRQDIVKAIHTMNRIASCNWILDVENISHHIGFSETLAKELFERITKDINGGW